MELELADFGEVKTIQIPLSALNGNVTVIPANYELKWKIMKWIFTSCVIVITVAGNAATLYGVCKMKSFRHSVSNLYIASLAGADLIVGAFVMTFMMLYTVVFEKQWIFGSVFCDIWQIVDFSSCTVSLYSVCAIGFDRWMNLEKPLRMFKRSKVIARKVIVCLWTGPILIWTPIVISLRMTSGQTSNTTTLCEVQWKPSYTAPVVASIIFYIPVLLLIALFARISVVIRNHLTFLRNHSNRSLLELDNRSGSPSLMLNPSPRSAGSGKPIVMNNGSPNNQQLSASTLPFKQLYKPTVLNLDKTPLPAIPDMSSKDRSSYGCNKPTCSITATLGIPAYRDRSSTTPGSIVTHFNNGNQSPLAIKMMKGHLTPSPTQENGNVVTNSVVSSIFRGNSFRRHSDSAKTKMYCLKPAAGKEAVPLLVQNKKNSQENKITAAFKANFFRQQRSVSRDSVLESPHDPVPPKHDQPRAYSTASCISQQQKRPSVTSDTAVVYTKSSLTHKPPPLLRAKTDNAIEVQHSQAERKRSARFSIISITGPLFNRRYSVNIFTDMLPCPNMTQQIRAAKAVGVLMVFFLICWLPYLILWPLKTYCTECVTDTVFNLAIWANYLNSTINPVLYTLCSPRFQRVFRENCRCTCKWSRQRRRSIK